MKASALIVALVTALLAAGPLGAQMTLEQAGEQGKAMGNEKKSDSTLVPRDDAQAEAVPGYAGTTLPEGAYFDDPDKLEAAAASAKSSNEQYKITTDAAHTRPTFSNDEILATTDRATQVENDPSAYLDGENITGGAGSCTPLPPGAGADGYYEATCNSGANIEESTPSCSVGLNHSFSTTHVYTCGTAFLTSEATRCVRYAGRRCLEYQTAVTSVETHNSCSGFEAAPQCTMSNEVFADQHRRITAGRTTYWSTSSDRTYTCSSEASSTPGGSSTRSFWRRTAAPPVYVGPQQHYEGTSRDESACSPYAGNSECSLQQEVCTSSDPVTREVEGVAITQPCWAWNRTYTCNHITTGNDCADLEANRSCTYLRDECLDEDPDGGPCKVSEKVYKCPTPGGVSADTSQYICGDDVYCINGDCEPIVREASTEFKDALVALHSIDQAGKEFDETNFTVFRGTRETCHKPVFGLINCCAGKVSGAVPVAAGAAALAGGPLAIAAFATPFLTLFACSQDEMKLDIKDRMGFCHKVGTYCSSSFLGICKTKRTAYCCFESKLSRVLQEQGRVQLGRPWGAPKKEQCEGFTIEEFALLDLSIMDFTEVYADFMDAAKLPDEVETMSEIQDKIQAYYDLHGK
ncbi:type-1V conjugative transfer system mating pair stabilization family protein (plasmid) [Sphingobium sp. RAC03]|nr:conjugal transfer protein TraN [Sphingobium sp. RAC03]AOF98546.1 type-1V conjugative transfer system mating pair stabilization family protein [Sphingobium sp. RAC03]